MRIHSYPKSKLSHDVNRKLASNDPLIIPYGHLKYLPFYWLKPIVSLNIQKSAHIGHNVFVYGKLRVCGRGFSEGKSEAGKQATNFVLAKTSNCLYTVLCGVFICPFLHICLHEL